MGAQTGATCAVLGQILGLFPEKIAEAKALQLNMDGADFLTEVLRPYDPYKNRVECLRKWMNHFEAALGDKAFFCGETVTYVDYLLLGSFYPVKLKVAKCSEDFRSMNMT